MKLLLDQGVPRLTAALLRRDGIDTVHTGEIGMATAEDEQILIRASFDERIIVTLDADFHSLLAVSQAVKPSVVRIRIEGLRAEEMAALIQRVILDCADDLNAGAMISVSEVQIRIRRLPVV
jgi:predicted nuclease of predicted toxin-antitoxin system